MKGFTRKEPMFSLCGLNCALCSMHVGGYCPGCGGGEGNQSCAMARCSLEHGGLEFCADCAEYPCARYEGFDDFDSFISHLHRAADLEKLREIGPEAYGAEQRERRALLLALLDRHEEGRRKILFRQAANLLDISVLRTVLAELDAAEEQPRRERAALAERRFRAAAEQAGIPLNLRRKAKK